MSKHILKIICVLALSGCGGVSDSLYWGALGLGEGSIFVATTNGTTSYTISRYSLNGEFISLVYDSTAEGYIPRGMALIDPFNILIAADGIDSLRVLNYMTGQRAEYYNNALLTGNIYQAARVSNNTYIIESNNIELFVGKSRFPTTGNAYIPTTTGACTISTARGLAVNNSENLIVTSFANNRILLYDISGTTPTCLASDASFGSNQPIPVVGHPNGNLYFGTQVNDAIYVAPDDLSSSPTTLLVGGVINNPTAMAVLPDGSLLVASDGTDTIVQIDAQNGAVLNGSFIKNGNTTTVTEILVVPSE